MKKTFFKIHPALMVGMLTSNALLIGWMNGSLNCWPCMLGDFAAAVVVGLVWLIWRNSVLSEKTWKERMLPAGKLTAFDKALLSMVATLGVGIFLIAITFAIALAK
jgi:hypothetical protein